MARTLTTCDTCGAQVADDERHAAWHGTVRRIDPSYLMTVSERVMPPDPPELVEAQRKLDRALADERAAQAKWSPVATAARQLEQQLIAKYRGHPLGFEQAATRAERQQLAQLVDADARLAQDYRAAAERTTEERQACANAQRVAMLAAIEAWKEPIA